MLVSIAGLSKGRKISEFTTFVLQTGLVSSAFVHGMDLLSYYGMFGWHA